jgi:hypothetical protein
MRNYRALTVIKMNHYFLLHYHPSLFLLPHLNQRLLMLLTNSSTAAVEVSRLEGEIISEQGAPLIFRRHIHLN